MLKPQHHTCKDCKLEYRGRMSTLLAFSYNTPDPNKHRDYWYCPVHKCHIEVESQYGRILFEKDRGEQDDSPYQFLENMKKTPKD